jgi:hypothetical protein
MDYKPDKPFAHNIYLFRVEPVSGILSRMLLFPGKPQNMISIAGAVPLKSLILEAPVKKKPAMIIC